MTAARPKMLVMLRTTAMQIEMKKMRKLNYPGKTIWFRDNLMAQVKSDGFTAEEAEYAGLAVGFLIGRKLI